ncbi:MAG TPA: tetratricopeptide repeat protein, partial [Longimicrobiales bacterium]|nr:tetratricopeptide repeat protein [Longimicrobiales bacterium]
MDELRRLISEIHRRSIWQVLGVYVVGAYVAYEVVVNLTEGLGLPEWVPPFALILFIIGLPVVLATAIVQEGAPGLGGAAGATVDDAPTAVSPVATAPLSPSAPAPPRPDADPQPPAARTLFTWPRAITGGVLAFALLGLATTGFMGMRALGVGPVGTLMGRGVLDARERIVLADFRGTAGGEEYTVAVRAALRSDLESSPVVQLLEDGAVERALRRMELDPSTTTLSPAVARELAVREGLRVTIEGEVAGLGSSWVVTARVVSAQAGETLASFRETAAGEGDLIGAVDRLSRSIREKIGENLASARAGEPLDQLTTSSLEALRLYGEAERLSTNSDYYGAALLLERALALDSTFAMAWRKLAVVLGNANSEPERRRVATTRAYELRERLSERERLITEAFYHDAEDDEERAKGAYRTLLDRYPADETGHVNLTALLVGEGRHDEALQLIERALASGIDHPLLYVHRATALWQLGRREDARASIVDALARHPLVPSVRRLELQTAMNLGDYARADSLLLAFEEDLPDEGFATTWKFLYRGWIDGAQGRFTAVERMVDGESAEVPENLHREALWTAAEWAAHYALQTGDTARARRRIDEAVRRYPLDGMSPADRPHGQLARAYALAGATDRAEAMQRADDERAGRGRDETSMNHALIHM